MNMANGDVYKRAINELFQKTNAKFEHDEEIAIELFDKLLDEGIDSHCDTVNQLCKEAGYDEYASKEIAQIYDILSLYKLYKKKEPMYWDISQLINP